MIELTLILYYKPNNARSLYWYSLLIFVYGDYILLEPEHESLFVYTRQDDSEAWLVALNFSDEETVIPPTLSRGQLVFGNYRILGSTETLRPWEGRIYRI